MHRPRSYLTIWPRTDSLPVVSRRWQGGSALDCAHEARLDKIVSDFGQNAKFGCTRDIAKSIT